MDLEDELRYCSINSAYCHQLSGCYNIKCIKSLAFIDIAWLKKLMFLIMSWDKLNPTIVGRSA